MPKEDVIEMVRAAVSRAASYTSDVEFSPMDASRSDRDFVFQVLEAAIEAGADDVVSDADSHEITCAPEAFFAVRDKLEETFGEFELQQTPEPQAGTEDGFAPGP